MFNLTDSIRSVLATSRLADPADIAQIVFDRTPVEDMPDAYLQLLRSKVREISRLENIETRQQYRNGPVPSQQRDTTGMQTTTIPNGSAKVAAIRQVHNAYYDQRVHAKGQSKLLGDCTIDDVFDLAAQRRQMAQKNVAIAREFESLAEQMHAAGVTYARQLDQRESKTA